MKMIRPPKLTAEQIKLKRDLPVGFTLEGHLRALDGWIDSLEVEPKIVNDNDELDIMQAALAHLRLPLGTPVGDLLTALREAPFPTQSKITYLVVHDFSVEPTTIFGASRSLDRAKEIATQRHRGDDRICDTLIYAMEDGKDYDWGPAPVVWKNGHDVVKEDVTP